MQQPQHHTSFESCKFSMDWNTRVYICLYQLVNVEEVTEGEQSALVEGLDASGPHCGKSTLKFVDLHQCIFNVDITPGSRPTMAEISSKMASMGSEASDDIFINRQKFQFFQYSVVQSCSFGLLILACGR